MSKLILFTFFFLSATLGLASITTRMNDVQSQDIQNLYKQLHLQDKINYKAFQQAVMGYHKIKVKKPVLTIIDFSKASTEKRMYVIDMKEKKVLFQSHVAHGKNSGLNKATSFSNKSGSKQSSLGFFLTEQSYHGKNGLSLKLDGLEKDINDNAKVRKIVMHGADYCNPQLAERQGRLGRSYGCPALPKELTKPIIDAIKGGSLIYIFSDSWNERYLRKSTILKS